MNFAKFLFVVFCMMIKIPSYANQIGYDSCRLLQDMIDLETYKIENSNPANHEELAEFYASRGESFLLGSQYQKAIQDFENATFHLAYFHNFDEATIVAFRITFGEAISYDNLGMQEHAEQAIQQLRTITNQIGCNSCKERHPCSAINTMRFNDMIMVCKNKNENASKQQTNQNNYNNLSGDSYSDIEGPNESPTSNWCEEVVIGTGRAMDAIACLAPNYCIRIALIGIIEALIARGLKCCQAGGFWKACVAPIARKWKAWDDYRKKNASSIDWDYLYYSY